MRCERRKQKSERLRIAQNYFKYDKGTWATRLNPEGVNTMMRGKRKEVSPLRFFRALKIALSAFKGRLFSDTLITIQAKKRSRLSVVLPQTPWRPRAGWRWPCARWAWTLTSADGTGLPRRAGMEWCSWKHEALNVCDGSFGIKIKKRQKEHARSKHHQMKDALVFTWHKYDIDSTKKC